jgi:phenylpyruvate tautomerase PptA (4-oxalocrotonate tautomerase family)
MPVVMITGPSGLTRDRKKQLIEGTLRVLTETEQMPDNRVYIHEVPVENVGHTPVLEVTDGGKWAVQSEPARIFVEVVAPPGLPIDSKRKLMRGLTEVAGRAYGLTDFRNVLVSLDEHKVEDFCGQRVPSDRKPGNGPVRGSAAAQVTE